MISKKGLFLAFCAVRLYLSIYSCSVVRAIVLGFDDCQLVSGPEFSALEAANGRGELMVGPYGLYKLSADKSFCCYIDPTNSTNYATWDTQLVDMFQAIARFRPGHRENQDEAQGQRRAARADHPANPADLWRTL